REQEAPMSPLEILDPTVETPKTVVAFVPRPDSLLGKRNGHVENTKFNSDRLLLKNGDVLKTEYGAAETRLFRKHNSSVPANLAEGELDQRARELAPQVVKLLLEGQE